jgi:hypothetical protein
MPRLILFTGCRIFYRKNRYKKGGYPVCLTHEYMHGRTDSRPDKNQFSCSSVKNSFFADEYLILSAQMFAPPSMYSWVRRA